MYGIFTRIYHKHQPNVGKYTSPMDSMSWAYFFDDGRVQRFNHHLQRSIIFSPFNTEVSRDLRGWKPCLTDFPGVFGKMTQVGLTHEGMNLPGFFFGDLHDFQILKANFGHEDYFV